ncbi:MAG: adenylyl-sulfate kinase [Patescibacteria group bacterium]
MENKTYNPDLELLKLVIAGSVDDGKSSLIGRLFFDLDEIYQDQLEALEKTSLKQGFSEIDLSLFTDGLSAEREQKITIDVAYRYFSTKKRRFIIADVPGHEQYTKNMATGASNADAALILADARKGLLIQSKRHLFLAALFGIRHVLVVVNKMDLVDYSESVFGDIKKDFSEFAAKLNIPDFQFIPVSAVKGDMVVARGENLNWYQGPTVLSYLESLEILSGQDLVNFRFPVQIVLRPNQDFRGYAGTIIGGAIKKEEEVLILPSNRKTKIKNIFLGEQETDYAFNPQAVVFSLTDEMDVSRGDMLVRENNLPEASTEIEANLAWFDDEPMKAGKIYLLKHTTKTTRCFVSELVNKINMENLHRESALDLNLNEIGKVYVKTTEPLIFDAFSKNHNTGSFVLIDEKTGSTAGAGIILDRGKKIVKETKGKGAVLWFTGLSGSGKTTIADDLFKKLENSGIRSERLDGDLMRESLSRDLGFSPQDRDKNIDRASFVSGLLARHGVLVLTTFISPYSRHRGLARSRADNFIEIFVNASLEECEKRDVKGLYQKARQGLVEYFTGITDPYEEPQNPEIELRTDLLSLDECVEKIMEYLKENDLI